MSETEINTTRRTVVRSAAWSVPVISVMATAPVFAASLNKFPGINGWVLVSTTDQDRNSYDLRFDSDEPGNGPDGAPYGLYIYDPNLDKGKVIDVYEAASITIWLRTDRSQNPASNWSLQGSGAGWSQPVSAGVMTKADGLQYRGYQFFYNGAFTLGADGRVYLADLVASTNDANSSDATYWVERKITVNGSLKQFERRNGERGTYGGASFRMAASNQHTV